MLFLHFSDLKILGLNLNYCDRNIPIGIILWKVLLIDKLKKIK